MLFDKSKNKEKAAILKKKCALLTLKYQTNAQHTAKLEYNTVKHNVQILNCSSTWRSSSERQTGLLVCSYLCVTLKTAVPQQSLTLILILVGKFTEAMIAYRDRQSALERSSQCSSSEFIRGLGIIFVPHFSVSPWRLPFWIVALHFNIQSLGQFLCCELCLHLLQNKEQSPSYTVLLPLQYSTRPGINEHNSHRLWQHRRLTAVSC